MDALRPDHPHDIVDHQVEQRRQRGVHVPEMPQRDFGGQDVRRQVARPGAIGIGDDHQRHAARHGVFRQQAEMPRIPPQVDEHQDIAGSRLGQFGIKPGAGIEAAHPVPDIAEVMGKPRRQPALGLETRHENAVGAGQQRHRGRPFRTFCQCVNAGDRCGFRPQPRVRPGGRIGRRGQQPRRIAEIGLEHVAAQIGLQRRHAAIAQGFQQPADRHRRYADPDADRGGGFERHRRQIVEQPAGNHPFGDGQAVIAVAQQVGDAAGHGAVVPRASSTSPARNATRFHCWRTNSGDWSA